MPEISIRVRFHELDPYGHLNHAVYLSYFEQARVDLLDHIGFGLSTLVSMGYQLVVVEAHVKFVAPVEASDTVTIVSSIGDVRPASSRWLQRMSCGDTLVATNDVRAAITDLTGRPTRAPAELTATLQQLRAT
ncbi:MAG: thioesterase family protein [Nitriliruptoraceae bacterium]